MDLLAVQGTLKSLLQHHSSKPSIPRCSASFTVQLSHPYMTTGKTTALTRRTLVGKVTSLLLHMLSRLVTQLTNPHPSFPLPLGSHPFCFLFKNLTTTGCCCSVTKLCPTLCDSLDCSTPGFSVLHYLLESAQTHAIQLSHPVSSPSPPAFHLSQRT